MNPKDYRVLAAWGKMIGSSAEYILIQQERAAREGAPGNATYRSPAEGWRTLKHVTNTGTKAYFYLNHPFMARKAWGPLYGA